MKKQKFKYQKKDQINIKINKIKKTKKTIKVKKYKISNFLFIKFFILHLYNLYFYIHLYYHAKLRIYYITIIIIKKFSLYI